MAETVVRADLYDGRTSGRQAVTLAIVLAEGRRALEVRPVEVGPEAVRTIPLAQLQFTARVGATHRLLSLPDGASLEVLDNAAFDEALRAAGVRAEEEPIRRLESRWRYALAAGISVLILAAAFLRFGLPFLAARAVRVIPPSVDSYIARDTLRVLDATTFCVSRLPPERQAQLREVFASVARDSSPQQSPFRLEFRAGGSIGANAIALPSGVVVLTDELAALSHDDDELRGVFAHEVGHLVNRHAMRMLVQTSASALLLVGVFGDASGASSLTVAAPTLLVQSAYSRDFERQADQFAFSWMSSHHVEPRHLGDLLERIAAQKNSEPGGFLASHPDFRERVRAARER